jgi:hypothetical protein
VMRSDVSNARQGSEEYAKKIQLDPLNRLERMSLHNLIVLSCVGFLRFSDLVISS